MRSVSATWAARKRVRAIESACAAVIFLSVSACSSGTGNGDDSASGGTGGGNASGGGSSGGSGNASSSSDKLPDCGAKALSATRLPGKNVSQARVAGGNVYYGDETGVSRVPLGNQANGGQTQLSTGGGGLYLNDTQFGTFERTTYPAGNLRLFPVSYTHLTLPTNREV